jgi:hypothetical protein
VQNGKSCAFPPQAANQSISECRDVSRSENENEIAWLEFSQQSLYDSVEVTDEMRVAMPVGGDCFHEWC